MIQHLQFSYLPPLMVYLAAGISGLTGIVGTFFNKDYLDLPAEFLTMLGFWAGLPWALKMPLESWFVISALLAPISTWITLSTR